MTGTGGSAMSETTTPELAATGALAMTAPKMTMTVAVEQMPVTGWWG
jgi:hypothetical protein